MKRRLQACKILPTLFDEGGQLLELCAADRRLHIRDLEVVAEVRVDVLVIVALRQFAVLSVETVAAEAILARRADAVAPPVAQRTQDAEEQSVLRIDGAALAHCHVVRWVEARRADVADRSRIALPAVNLIARAERVAIVLNEPKPMLFAKCLDRPKVERVAERVREHDGTRLGRQRLFQPRDVDVVLRDRHVNEDGHGAVLDDRRDRRREACRDRDDFIARTHGALAEERRSQRHESQQIRRRTRIDGERVARAEKCGQPLLELCSIAPAVSQNSKELSTRASISS